MEGEMNADVVGTSRRYKSLRIRNVNPNTLPALPAQQAEILTKRKDKIDESASQRLDTNKDKDDAEKRQQQQQRAVRGRTRNSTRPGFGGQCTQIGARGCQEPTAAYKGADS